MSSAQMIFRRLEEMQTQLDYLKDEVEHFVSQNTIDESIVEDESPTTNIVPPTYPDEEIVGGDETDEYPDCCAIGNEVDGYYCSGTLVAPMLVVTAAHCQNVSKVFLGGNDIGEPRRGETIAVVQTYTHPDLDFRVLILAHSATIAPRRIAQNVAIEDAKNAMLVGFGTIDLNGSVGYGKKRKVTTPITTLDCATPGEARRYGCVKGYEIVAGHRGLGKDSCRGDSGCPLYIQDAAGRYVLLGATSRGARGSDHVCGDGGIYVRVDLCIDWIEQVTGVKLRAG